MSTSPHALAPSVGAVSVRTLVVIVMALFAGMMLTAGQASAAISFPAGMVFVNDEDGANDEPGQKDLTRLGIDYAGLPSSLQVSWNWDNTGWPGANTGDACAMFDTDSDGRVNYSLCAIVEGDPAVYKGTRMYSCGDDKVDRCTNPITEIISFDSTCDMEVTSTDPFTSGTDYPQDTSALCTAVLADFGGAINPKLVNVCSFPSGEPNSDPSDCVMIPRDGFLTIVKVADPDDSDTNFSFRMDGKPTIVFTAHGSETSAVIPVRSDIDHSIEESKPSNWDLRSAQCSNESGTLSGTTLSDISFSSDESVTCTFTNERRPTLTVVKEVVNDNSGALDAGDFSLHVTSGGADVAGSPQPGSTTGTSYTLTPGSYVVGEDAVTGYDSTISGDCASDGSISLGVGDDRTCTVTNDDVIHPSIAISKSASPTTIRPGDTVDYTIVVENDGDDPLTNVRLLDDTCSPLTYQSGDTGDDGIMGVEEQWIYTCSTTLSADRVNTVSVIADDSGGGTVTGSAIAEVDVINPSIEVRKTPDQTSVTAGTTVTYTIEVENTGDTKLTNVNLNDDVCSPLEYQSGDDGDEALEVDETWIYTCSKEINERTVNVVTVTADTVDDDTVTDNDAATVEIKATPTEPTGSTGPTVGAEAVAPVAKVGSYDNCISRRFTMRVRTSGGTPQTTVLKVDGKRRATSRSSNPKFVIDTRKYSVGRHRVRVEVTFTNGKKAFSNASFERCKIKVAAPKYTG